VAGSVCENGSVFHVYVEGVTGMAADAVRRLSDAIAARYGFPATEIFARLNKGRLRVKANCDQQTADDLARELEALGARVRIEDAPRDAAATPAALRPTVAAAPAVRTSPAIVRRTIAPPAPVAAPPEPTAPPATSTRPTKLALPQRARPVSQQPAAPPEPVVPPAPREDRTVPPLRPPQQLTPPQAPAARPPDRAGRLSTLPTQTIAASAGAQIASPGPSRPARSSSLPPPAPRAAPSALPAASVPRSSTPALPPAALPRSSTPALRSAMPSQPPMPSGSGLSVGDVDDAASEFDEFGGGGDAGGLGALGALGRGDLLSLEPLDGEPPAARGAFAGAGDGLSASIGPAMSRPSSGAARGGAAPVDRFAPPEQAGEDFAVELAPDDVAHRARKRNSAPPVFAPEPPARREAPRLVSPSAPPLRGSMPLLQSPTTLPPPRPGPRAHPTLSPVLGALAPPAQVPEPRVARGMRSPLYRLGAAPRARFATGVLLAIVLGFIPAAVIGAVRQRSAFRTIDDRVAAVQAAVDSPQGYEALDAFRADQLEAKRSARRMIVLTSMLLWAAAGGGLAYVWFKRVPWSRYT